MVIDRDADCIALRRQYERSLLRQQYYVYAFDTAAVPGPSIAAANKYLVDKAVAWLEARNRSYRSSFSVWTKLTPMPWWTGARCLALFIGGRSATADLGDELRSWEGFAAVEGAVPFDYDAIVRGVYDPNTTTLHVSKPPVAVFLPSDTNLRQHKRGGWFLAGMRSAIDGEWIEDFTQSSGAYRTYQGTEDAARFFDGAVALHLEKLPAEIVNQLEAISAHAHTPRNLVRDMLSHAKSVNDVERFIAQAQLVYGEARAL